MSSRLQYLPLVGRFIQPVHHWKLCFCAPETARSPDVRPGLAIRTCDSESGAECLLEGVESRCRKKVNGCLAG
eukprot:1609656-Rhodomonas_salina.3